MKLVKISDNNSKSYLNIDYIEFICEDIDGNFRAYTYRNNNFYYISESAYNTILKYGKAKV
jgi:hypothetical protein